MKKSIKIIAFLSILPLCLFGCGKSNSKTSDKNEQISVLTPEDAETWSEAMKNNSETISESENKNSLENENTSSSSEIGNTNSENFETSVMQETEIKIEGNSWEDLYKKVLDEYKGNAVYYDYVYIDDDDIPELMWTDGNYKVAQTNLYTVKNNKIYYLNTLSTYGTLNYIERKGIIYTGTSSQGSEIFNVYKLEDTTLNLFSCGESNRNTGATGNDLKNIVDGQNVSSDEFNKSFEQYIDDPDYKTTTGKPIE